MFRLQNTEDKTFFSFVCFPGAVGTTSDPRQSWLQAEHKNNELPRMPNIGRAEKTDRIQIRINKLPVMRNAHC